MSDSKKSRLSHLIGALPEWVLPGTRADRRFVLVALGVLLLVTSAPYFYAHLTEPPDRHFMGIMLDVPDHAQYFSWMRELTDGHLAENKLTPEPNRPLFFNLLWWSLGRLSRVLGVGYQAAFQLLRITAAAVFLVLVFRMCRWFLPENNMRRTAFLIILLTSGFGWVLVLLKYTVTGGELLFPLDVFVVEGNTFLGVMAYPHFIAAASYILVFELVLRGKKKNQHRYSICAGLVAFWLGWQHAYDLALIYGILGAYVFSVALRDRRLPWFLVKSAAIVGILSVWPAAYSVALTSLDPVWEQVLAQFANAGVYTPGPLHLPILLGPAFLLALWGLWKERAFVISDVNDDQLFLRTWFLANLILIYLPVDYQIHLLNGIQVPMGILATQTLYVHVGPSLSQSLAKFPIVSGRPSGAALAAVAVIVIIPTNLYLWTWRFVDIGRYDYPYFLHRDEVAALRWLEGTANEEDVVIASLTLGQYVPALTGAHTFLGHWAQTISFFEKRQIVEEFYSTERDDQWRARVMGEYGVDYALYGPAERSLGDFRPGESDLFFSAFSSEQVSVYGVRSTRDLSLEETTDTPREE